MALIDRAKVAMMSEVTVEEFDKYVTKMVKDKPAAYETNMGSGNVSKKSTVGRIKALFDDFKKEYPKKVTTDEAYQYMKQFDRALNAGACINNYTPSSLNELVRNNQIFKKNN